jgi:SSS family transporter
MDVQALIVLSLFLAFQMGIAIYAGRKVKSEVDYLIGGRSLGIMLASFTLFATWFGAETVMASSGAIAAEGLSGGRAEPFGYALCLLLFAIFIAYRMRAANFVTSADFYRQRFGIPAEKLSVLLVIPTSLIWSAAQIVAFAHVVSAITGMDFQTALMAGSGAVILFTMIGGYTGDVITDFVMGLIVITGLIVTAVFVTMHIGGLDMALAKITPEKLNIVAPDTSLMAQMDEWVIAIVGSLVAQEAISRFLGARSPQVARTSCFTAAGMYFVVGLIPVYIGLVGAGIIPVGESSDAFLPDLAKSVLPEFAYIFFLAALVSAILSTINSTILSVGALAGHNIIMPLARATFKTERQKVMLERGMVAVAGVLTYLIAESGESIYALIEASSSFGSAGLIVCLIFGLWTRIGGPKAALATMAVGVVSSYVYQYALEWEAGFMASLLSALVVYLAVAALEKKSFMTGPDYARG